MQSFRFVHDNAENLGRLGICLAYLQKYCQKMTNFRVLSGDFFVFFCQLSQNCMVIGQVLKFWIIYKHLSKSGDRGPN